MLQESAEYLMLCYYMAVILSLGVLVFYCKGLRFTAGRGGHLKISHLHDKSL